MSEEEIFAAMRLILTATKLVPEPSGAVTLAASLYHAEEIGLDKIVVARSQWCSAVATWSRN